MVYRMLALSLLPVALCASGCDIQNCTLADCNNGAGLTIEAGGELLPEGTLEFILELDGEIYELDCPSAEFTCGPVEGPDTPVSITVERYDASITLGVSTLERSDMPDVYRLEVFLDGQPLLEETGSFEYETFEPNGPDCAPICDNATPVSFTLPAVSE